MHQSNLKIWPRRVICSGLFAVICAVGAHDAFAQTEDFPIENGGGSTVRCLSAGAIQRTGKPFGSSPTTVTGCVLGGDRPVGLDPLPISIYCKGGFPIQFHPANGKLQFCTLLYDATIQNASNTPMACKAGLAVQFGTDGRLAACNLPPQTPIGPGNPPPQPPGVSGSRAPIVVPGESATLAGVGQYTLIGASSNRPGSRAGYLYLGDGRASATYTAQAPVAGKYALWIRFDDDGQHAAGARGVEISVNGTVAIRWNNESRALPGWTNIPVGSVDLRAGANTIVFTKTATTSAAFVLDEFVLSDQPGFVPQ